MADIVELKTKDDDMITAHLRMTLPSNIEVLTDMDEQITLDATASHCRLSSDKLTSQEAACFPDLMQSHPATQKVYIYIRNKILQFWLQNCQEQLSYAEALQSLPPPYNSDKVLIFRIFNFLERYGFINFGFFVQTTGHKRANRKVVVIGAGVAGLTAARQLQYFGFDVVVVEARNRVGGRISTFRKDNFIADLGAMIVTGLNGNPMSVLARQVMIDLRKIRSKCPIYENGNMTVPKHLDEHVEREFNRLLEATTYISHSLGLNSIDDVPLSLGAALEAVLKLQEKKTVETLTEFWKSLTEFQDKYKDLLRKMLHLKETCRKLRFELDRFNIDNYPSTDNADEKIAIGEFMRKSLERDLRIACKKYEKLEGLETELLETIKELEDNHPNETYLNPREKRIMDWHMANLEFANATPLNKLSLKHWDQDDEFELSGSHLSVRNGYNVLPLELAKGLDIRMDSVVKVVRQTKSGISVELTDANPDVRRKELLDANAVLCTLPLGVLKSSLENPEAHSSTQFEPMLPTWKSDSIRRLGFGNLNKVVLCFDKIFWDPNINVFGYVEPSRSARGELFQFWSFGNNGVLLGLVAGEAAEQMEQISDDIIVGRCLQVLRSMFGNSSVPTPRETIVTRWRSDPWTRGSYSFVGCDASGDDYDILAAPVSLGAREENLHKDSPRLFFAGEHTIRNYPATVHGAMISGLREAGRIADLFIGCSYGPTMIPPTTQDQMKMEDVLVRPTSTDDHS